MIRRLKVAVLSGGKSPEHKVSLISGREVVRYLDPQKYDALPIIVSRDGITWQVGERNQFLAESPTAKKIKNQKSKVKSQKINNLRPLVNDKRSQS